MIDRQLTPPRLGACTRRIAPASPGTKAHRPCHRTSRPHCLVQTLPATTAITDQPSMEHELDLRQTLESLAAPGSAPAGGSAAALCGAIAAAVTLEVARSSKQDGLAAQAAALAARLADLAPSDAIALAAARAALSSASEGGGV